MVAATDNSGDSDTQSFDLRVTGSNDAPVITNAPRTTTQVGRPFNHQVDATDADGDPLTFTLTSGPVGMVMDAQGLVQWTPTSVTPAGSPAAYTVSVSDGQGGVDTENYTLSVTNELNNHAPVITSTAKIKAVANITYRYQPTATDADNDRLAWSLTDSTGGSDLPRGMGIDNATGLIQWTPTPDQVGPHDVILRVTDAYGGSDTQAITITVRGTNTPARITSTPPTTGVVNEQYVYNTVAVDDDGDDMIFSLDPATIVGNMAINATTGRVTFTPTATGTVRFNVRVKDVFGAGVQQIFDVVVSNAGGGSTNNPPTITSTPTLVATAGSEYTYDVNATDPNNDTLTYAITEPASLPSGAAFNPSTGLLTWTPDGALIGTTVYFTTTATDPGGLKATQRWGVAVKAANTPPVINSSAPTESR